MNRPRGDIAAALRQLADNRGLAGQVNGLFVPSIAYGSHQMQWLAGALGGISPLADAAWAVDEPTMGLALLRLAGPRLQAAISGVTLLAAWVDFLNLAEAILRQCPAYSVERLLRNIHRVQQLIEPSMRALSSLEPAQVEAATAALPALMGQLTQEFHSLREGARASMERAGQFIAAAQAIEMLTMVSMLKLSLPRLPPTAPALVGVGLVMGSNGVMMGSQLVVTAEWVELMRRLVRAGVLSAFAVGAAVRIHAGLVLMAQANQALPQGVREALGEGPEVSAIHETGKAGAGMAERPQHHVLPEEFREWFEKRGFNGSMDIDKFCVELEQAHHQAVHGGGNWRLGRTWPREWNQMIMKALRDAELEVGRRLTRNEVLNLVAERMKDYGIPMNFTPWRGR
ncbi:DUF2380 domain-containing protein [Hyalangium gracile]|uniref:DUF2380 domain-containing protein n=1 Tax=Hyalangium gracile TaxID=394092 RepID=UPI001CCD10F4|nr:DUF2380 domain-containing protein [Hyalangium gracile]